MSSGSDLIALIASRQDVAEYQKIHWNGTFADYLEIVRQSPRVARSAYQRLYDMILSHGVEEHVVNKEKFLRHKFFDDPIDGGEDAVFGLDRTLMSLVNVLKSAAHGYGTERRVLLLHGPVGSSKSTIVRLMKKGLEHYSKTDDGALFTYQWRETGADGDESWVDCPMHEEPLHLIPDELRPEVEREYGIYIEGELCPKCRYDLQHVYGGRAEDVRVERIVFSEKHRRGIGTFTPSDPKSQDIAELVGGIDLSTIGEVGTESDPRAYRFDGELNIANRGLMEFVEMLKCDENSASAA